MPQIILDVNSEGVSHAVDAGLLSRLDPAFKLADPKVWGGGTVTAEQLAAEMRALAEPPPPRGGYVVSPALFRRMCEFVGVDPDEARDGIMELEDGSWRPRRP